MVLFGARRHSRHIKGQETYHDEVKQYRLLELGHEVLVPRENIVSATLVLLVLARRGVGVLYLVLSVLLNKLHDGLGYVGDGNLSIGTQI